MKDLVTITTRISKDLKEKVKCFSENNKVRTQVIYGVALRDFLKKYEGNGGKSETTLFLENKINEYQNKNNDISRELLEDLIYFLEESDVKLDENTNRLITKYKSNSEVIETSILLREESLR